MATPLSQPKINILIASLITASIFILICTPLIILSLPIVAVLLFTKWDGRSTIFGNAKWGRATTHPIHPTNGYWQELNWLTLRNPVNNLVTNILSVKPLNDYTTIQGDPLINEHSHAGYYFVQSLTENSRLIWEYYLILPYGKRCLRIRIGWKILNSDSPAAFVFSIIPFKTYTGS